MLFCKIKKNKMLSKETILKLITAEKNSYNKYKELCVLYKITPDPIASTRSLSIIETLTLIVNML